MRGGSTGYGGGEQQQELAVIALVKQEPALADLHETYERQFADDGHEHSARSSAEPAHRRRNQHQHQKPDGDGAMSGGQDAAGDQRARAAPSEPEFPGQVRAGASPPRILS